MNTTYFLNQIMGVVFGTQKTPALPSQYFLGLSTTEPTVSGTCNGEVSTIGTGYERILLDNLSAPSNGTINNTSAIAFEESTASWGKVKYYVAYDAKTGGNLLFFDKFENERTVEPGTVLMIKTGELSIELCNKDS